MSTAKLKMNKQNGTIKWINSNQIKLHDLVAEKNEKIHKFLSTISLENICYSAVVPIASQSTTHIYICVICIQEKLYKLSSSFSSFFLKLSHCTHISFTWNTFLWYARHTFSLTHLVFYFSCLSIYIRIESNRFVCSIYNLWCCFFSLYLKGQLKSFGSYWKKERKKNGKQSLKFTLECNRYLEFNLIALI